MNCKKCGKRIPSSVWIGDRKKYVSNHRNFCFDCSPFGSHNTLDLTKEKKATEIMERTCPECGRKHRRRGFVCNTCVFKAKMNRTIKKVEELVGGACWICGYGKTKRSLCFHHVVHGSKAFSLTYREINGYAWDRVLTEIKKCVFICSNCHGEIHDGVVSDSFVDELWIKEWETRACSSTG